MIPTVNNSGIELAILRIGVAITVLVKVCVEFNQLDLLFSQHGIIQHVLSNSLQQSYSVSLPEFIEFFGIKNEHSFLIYIYLIDAIAALFLLIGFQTRISACICLFIHMLIFNGYNLIAFGFDGFLFTLLFYALLFPVGKVFSVDNLIYKKGRVINEKNLQLYVRVLQIHLCIVYFTAGFAKLKGHEWIDGTAIWNAINQPQFHTICTPFIKSIVSYPGCSVLLSWATLFVEAGFFLLIWIKKFRINRMMLNGVIFMHLFIGVVMGLQLFAWIMIVFDLSAFAGVFFKRKINKPSTDNYKPKPFVVYAV